MARKARVCVVQLSQRTGRNTVAASSALRASDGDHALTLTHYFATISFALWLCAMAVRSSLRYHEM